MLLTIVSNSTKLIHQRLDKIGADIIDITEKLKENVKDVDDLKQSLQMYQDTNGNKLVEIDNSIKQQKIERIAQVEVCSRYTMNPRKNFKTWRIDLNEITIV